MANLARKLWFKGIAVILIQAFLCLDFCWAAGGQQNLSPRVTVGTEQTTNDFKTAYDQVLSRSNLNKGLSAEKIEPDHEARTSRNIVFAVAIASAISASTLAILAYKLADKYPAIAIVAGMTAIAAGVIGAAAWYIFNPVNWYKRVAAKTLSFGKFLHAMEQLEKVGLEKEKLKELYITGLKNGFITDSGERHTIFGKIAALGETIGREDLKGIYLIGIKMVLENESDEFTRNIKNLELYQELDVLGFAVVFKGPARISGRGNGDRAKKAVIQKIAREGGIAVQAREGELHYRFQLLRSLLDTGYNYTFYPVFINDRQQIAAQTTENELGVETGAVKKGHPAYAFRNMPKGKFTLSQYIEQTSVPRPTASRDFRVLEQLGLVNISRQAGKPNLIELNPAHAEVPAEVIAGALDAYKNINDIADIKTAVAEKISNWMASLPGLEPQALPGLITTSNDLVNRMIAAYDSNDKEAMEEAFNAAKVKTLPGPSADKPHLFAVTSGREPKHVDAAKLANKEITALMEAYMPGLNLTPTEIKNLKAKTPFDFTTKEDSERIGRIYQAALATGLLGTRYIITNIKRFSPNSHLAYIQFLRRITNEFNGNVVILLSVEESPDVLQGDGAGMATAAQAIEQVLGREFLRDNDIDIITDGGLKSRGGNWIGLYGYNGAMPTPFGMPYYLNALIALGKVRLQHKQFGEKRIYWIASDGDYDISKLSYGENKQESELEDDNSWSMVIHGQEQEVFPLEQKDEIFTAIEDIAEVRKMAARHAEERLGYEGLSEQEVSGDKDRQKIRKLKLEMYYDEFLEKYYSRKNEKVGKVLEYINTEKLDSLGENFSDPKTGQLLHFKEKPSAMEILEMLKKFDTNRIIPNAFLLFYSKDAFFKQIDAYYALSGNKRLAGYGGSYFQAVVESKDNPAVLSKYPAGIENVSAVFPKDTIIAAGLGPEGRFSDRGKTDFLSNFFQDWIEWQKGKGVRNRMIDVRLSDPDKITIETLSGATVILENVDLVVPEGVGPVKLIIEGDAVIRNSAITLNGDVRLWNGVFIQDSGLKLAKDTTFYDNTLVIASYIAGPLKMHPNGNSGNSVLLGVTFTSEEELFDLKRNDVPRAGEDGWEWEPIDVLDVFHGETIAGIRTRGGLNYINRTFTNVGYKDEKIINVIEHFEATAARHPRLIGIRPVSDRNTLTSEETELITLRNWLNDRRESVDISDAKADMDYLEAYKSLGLITTPMPRKNPDGAPGSLVLTGTDISRNWRKAVEEGKIKVPFDRDIEGKIEAIEIGVRVDSSGELEFYGTNTTRGEEIAAAVDEKEIGDLTIQLNGFRGLRPGVTDARPLGRQADLRSHADLCQFACQDRGNKMSLLVNEPLYTRNINGTIWRAYNNAAPFEKAGHFLLVPDILDENQIRVQKAMEKDISDMVTLMRDSQNVAIFFNAAHAGASVNHIHFQGVYHPEPLAAEKADTVPVFTHNSTLISRLVNFHASGFVFESNDEDDLSEAVWQAVNLLQEEGIPFNLIFAGSKAYLFPRDIDNGIVEEFPTGVLGAMEMMGKVIVIDQKTYDEIEGPAGMNKIRNGFAKACLSPEKSIQLFSEIFSKIDASSVNLRQPGLEINLPVLIEQAI